MTVSAYLVCALFAVSIFSARTMAKHVIDINNDHVDSKLAAGGKGTGVPTIAYQWHLLNFTFPTSEAREQYFSCDLVGSGVCPSLQTQPVGFRVRSNGDLFLSVPRFHVGVPATVAVVRAADLKRSVDDDGSVTDAVLTPYPSWAANDLNTSTAIVSVMGLQIDTKDRLWILDNGKAAELGSSPATPKILVYNLTDDSLISYYEFSEEVAPIATSFLNDLSIDDKTDTAYIADSSDPTQGTNGGLIVFSLLFNNAWRVLDSTVFTIANDTINVTINHVPQSPRPLAGADGIALSDDLSTLYWSPLTSHMMYSIPTIPLLKQSPEKVLLKEVSTVVQKNFSSDGIISHKGTIYMGSLDDSAIYAFPYAQNTSNSGLSTAPLTLIAQNETSMQWPDTLGVDVDGNLMWLTDGAAHFLPLNASAINYRIWSMDV
eukprot:TRINITY_DN2267_c0_g1_i7.p1 TRINITY_DN2267_c0_g1~~TRINITY_DN2267_c0_g1_i7.p1  ORF type:complete len:431 (-),score=51.45 TRINITY_DN2267_c0_g1_i7:402-1694(-)